MAPAQRWHANSWSVPYFCAGAGPPWHCPPKRRPINLINPQKKNLKKGLVSLHRTIQLQLLQHYWLGHRLELLWYWIICLENEQRSFCHYWQKHFSLLQGIFPTQVSNPGLPHCRQILYQLSHKGSPHTERGLKKKGQVFIWHLNSSRQVWVLGVLVQNVATGKENSQSTGERYI